MNQLRLLVSIAGLAAISSAQSGSIAPDVRTDLLKGLRVPLHTVPAGESGTPELWAGGTDFKASFAAGVTFLPRPAAPTDRASPWRWDTTTIRVAGKDQSLALREDAVIIDAFHCEIVLAPGVRERYEVLPHGLEQTFVLTMPLTGDVEIVGSVSGAYTADERAPMHADIRFRSDDGRSAMTFGAATAIDADGRRLPLETGWRDGRLSIRVPSDWLARASFPVVVDPLLAPVTLSTASAPVTGMTVERDLSRSTANVAVALSRTFASTDDDVFMILCDDGFAAPRVVFSRITLASETEPDLAVVLPADRFVVAWGRSTGVASSEQVWLHAHALGATGFDSTASQLPSPQGGRQRRAAVGGADYARSAVGVALILREVEPANTTGETNATSIWGTLWTPATGAMTHLEIAAASQQDTMYPAVSRSHDNHTWMVAWQRLATFGARRQTVIARHVGIDGSLNGGGFFTDRETLAEHKMRPKLDGRNGRYLISFGTVGAAAGSLPPTDDVAEMLWVQRFDWPYASSVPTRTHPSTRIATASGGRFMRTGDVAMDVTTSSHWAVTHSIDSPLGRYVTLSVVGYRGLERDRHVLGFDGAWPSATTFDQAGRRFLVAFAQQPLGTANHGVVGRVWQYPTQSAPVGYGNRCGTATISAGESPWRIGAEFPYVRLSTAGASRPAALLLSREAADLPLDPYGFTGCRLLVDLAPTAFVTSLGTSTSASGSAVLEFPLPETLSAFDLCFQWIHANASAPGGIQTSDATRVEIR
ncbi:MAG: hypothetical protein IPM29_25565 [Planctomycetes bacterium]|nr:hypothetical protein [Planctomycetota bacterium]